MNKISRTIQNSLTKHSLISFLTAGYPKLSTTMEAIQVFDQLGVTIIEVGLPYSVPLADGPIIQHASITALSNGTSYSKILKLISKVNKAINTPLIVFAYYNIIVNQSITIFIQQLSRIGVQGLLIPDLPIEEADYIIYLCNEFDVELIFLVAPTTSYLRIKKIVRKSFGCIYLVSKTGITGTSSDKSVNIKYFINRIKNLTNRTLILGFGISTILQIQQLDELSINGIVIGSAFTKRLSSKTNKIEQLSRFCRKIIWIIEKKKYICKNH